MHQIDLWISDFTQFAPNEIHITNSLSFSDAQRITFISPLKFQNKVQAFNLASRDPLVVCFSSVKTPTHSNLN